MSKSKTKAASTESLRRKCYFVLRKGINSKIHVEWEEPSGCPPKFNLNFIDDRIANRACEHQVVAYHVGHDHNYGYRHRHHYQAAVPQRLDDSHDWYKCANLFIGEAQHELAVADLPVPAYLLVPTLVCIRMEKLITQSAASPMAETTSGLCCLCLISLSRLCP
jgi:hypothetical protein